MLSRLTIQKYSISEWSFQRSALSQPLILFLLNVYLPFLWQAAECLPVIKKSTMPNCL